MTAQISHAQDTLVLRVTTALCSGTAARSGQNDGPLLVDSSGLNAAFSTIYCFACLYSVPTGGGGEY